MTDHTTHFDDCGCKSKALETELDALRLRVAALEANLIDALNMVCKEGNSAYDCAVVLTDVVTRSKGDTTALRAMLVPAFNAGFNARDNGEGMNGYEDGDDYADRILGASKGGGE